MRDSSRARSCSLHSFDYAGLAGYRDHSVIVAGCSISALEIASELALAGARRVTVTLRRQRYVLQKLTAGVPTDHVAFTRFAALAKAVMPPAAVAQSLRNPVVSSTGSPEQVGAPAPDADIFLVGPDRRADAVARTMTDAALFGCLTSPSMTDEEAARWESVRAGLR